MVHVIIILLINFTCFGLDQKDAERELQELEAQQAPLKHAHEAQQIAKEHAEVRPAQPHQAPAVHELPQLAPIEQNQAHKKAVLSLLIIAACVSIGSAIGLDIKAQPTTCTMSDNPCLADDEYLDQAHCMDMKFSFPVIVGYTSCAKPFPGPRRTAREIKAIIKQKLNWNSTSLCIKQNDQLVSANLCSDPQGDIDWINRNWPPAQNNGQNKLALQQALYGNSTSASNHTTSAQNTRNRLQRKNRIKNEHTGR